MPAAPTSLKAARAELVADLSLTGITFCHAYAGAADAWLGSLLDSATGGDTRRVALIAVGGYGRGELCPGSDLDVTFVHHPRLRHVKRLADAVWYPVWDEGVHLDHSVRTPKQVLAMAKQDPKVMLGLLDARLVAGDASLADEVIGEVRDQWRPRAAEFVASLQESIGQRHAARGDVAFLLEPDIKEDRGGLRDLHAIHTVAAAIGGITDPGRNPDLRRANQVLLSVRVELHRRSAKATDRLVLEEQDPIAAALGYTDADALMTAVATAGRTVAWAVDDCWRRAGRLLASPKARPLEPDRALEKGIVLHEGEIALETAADPASDSSLAFRCAAAAAETGLPISHACLRTLEEQVPTPADRWPGALLQSLVRLLGTGRSALREIETLEHYGLFTRMIPEWEAVRNKPQRNALHRFTVDRHLLEAAANACAFVREVSRPDLLLVGALFHDIGKGFPGDHTAAGMEVVSRLGGRMGLATADVGTLVSLVEHHLLLPDTAARRDLDDPATIDMVAGKVGNEDLLELLSALTQADSIATGPSVSSPWKLRMVRELAGRTANRLVGLPATPTEAPVPPDEVLQKLVAAVAYTRRPATEHEDLPDGDGWELRVAAPDRPGLLAAVAGVLALHGLNVRSAQVDAPAPGIAGERFTVAPMFATEPKWDRLAPDIADALDGRLDIDARLDVKIADYSGMRRPGSAQAAEARVIVDNEASRRATVVEVRAPDGIGVLHRITAALLECGLDIATAMVQTLGHEVVDTFYVRRVVEGTPVKVSHPSDLARIESKVLARLAPSAKS